MNKKQLTEDKYLFYKKHGLHDRAILVEYQLTDQELKSLKKKWRNEYDT